MPWDVSDAELKDAKLFWAIADMSEPMEVLDKHVRAAIDDNFAGEWNGAEHWKHLAPATLEDRARKGFAPGPILQRTQALKRSMESDWDADSLAVGPNESEAPYARFHEEGTSRMVARPYLALSEADMDKAAEIAMDEIVRVANR